ncbi:hypothetical protein HNR23_003527 [Nocardiopsis mwathae]|uniref:SH3 domain-containing protein n=1 Tax=Nocardiopsis mwathae TaxID=1472723 RepID=A0A7W9YK10_9ACTN|nr:hypothetical protein [Nocardiopsis mwathae]MBB6173467.1 hypothetical protein [Nocardiopsis mwathae]
MSHAWLLRAVAVAAIGALTLASLPAGEREAAAVARTQPYGAGGEWIEEDLTAADRVGAVLDGDRIRVRRDGRDGRGRGSGRDGDMPLVASLRESGTGRPADRLAPDTRTALPRTLEREVGAATATFPVHDLDDPVSSVEVAVDAAGDPAGFRIEVRGLRPDGIWTEWREARGPGTVARRTGPTATTSRVNGRWVALAAPAEGVQVRVGITEGADADAALHGVRIRPGPAHAPADDSEAEDAGEPFSARVFATRIGLVGGTTANGHRVRVHDHFVALPSRRGLAARGGGEYTVRVCTTGGNRRCAYMPVWDVGPWNIRDDYWNDGREMWNDLPRGTPQAQAAHRDGHNGGADGFGRKVRNPAGIDLADGAFREALGLRDNAWVDVDYLWTATYAHRAEIGTASETDPVIVRPGPGAAFPASGLAAHKANVDVICQVSGDRATGPQGESDVWYRIGEGDYVPAAFVRGGHTAPACEGPEAEEDGGAEAAEEPAEDHSPAPSAPDGAEDTEN